MKSAPKNVHLPLPEALYNELRTVAREAGQPAIELAQALMRAGLDDRRRAHRRLQIAAYAREVAGSRDDLDPDLERAGLESLVDTKLARRTGRAGRAR